MRTGFEGGFAQWSISEKDRLATYLEIMKRNDPTGHQHSPASIPTPDNALRHIARITLNKDLNLTLHPNFDRNNHIPTPGADDIPSAFDQEEYRREYDVYNTAMGTLNGIKTDLDSKIRENERIISQFVESENR